VADRAAGVGHFIAFTYVRPLLTSVSGVDASWIGALLFGYGLAGIAGNFIAGPLAARHPRGMLLAIASGLLLTPLLFLWWEIRPPQVLRCCCCGVWPMAVYRWA
jgi:predicted MFS family arabinose efflux permease